MIRIVTNDRPVNCWSVVAVWYGREREVRHGDVFTCLHYAKQLRTMYGSER